MKLGKDTIAKIFASFCNDAHTRRCTLRETNLTCPFKESCPDISKEKWLRVLEDMPEENEKTSQDNDCGYWVGKFYNPDGCLLMSNDVKASEPGARLLCENMLKKQFVDCYLPKTFKHAVQPEIVDGLIKAATSVGHRWEIEYHKAK